ncbi:MAG: efflux RND transporter periplasmic adaptor subunit [Proteobacteria bacterium]|nr:efflux RND transporter periplasmic adaptor subunit [Pseudomonadota bacterium]
MTTEPHRIVPLAPASAESGPRRATRIAAGAALAVLVVVSGCSRSASDAATPAAASTPQNLRLNAAQRRHVTIRAVTVTTLRGSLAADGTVDFDNDRATSVVAPFSGPVVRVLVQPGQQVHKGEPLAIVDSADFAAAIDAYAKAIVTAKNLRRIADADADLVQHKGVSARENEQAQADASSAAADRDAARQALLALGMDTATIAAVQAGAVSAHGKGVIRAPIAGTVAEKLVSPGTLLQAGATACFTIADLGRVWVMAQVSPSDLPSIAIGDPVDVLAPTTATPLHGTVDNIAAVVDPDSRAVIVRVVVDNPGDALKKQMYVGVRIHSRTGHRGIAVPSAAILRDDTNLPFVYAVAADGGFERRAVTLGARDGDDYEIASGLRAGDRIVVAGALFLQFMQSQ